MKSLSVGFALMALTSTCAGAAAPDPYNVVWDSPSKDANGSMPLGNGDIGLNAWIEPGGNLVFYISKTDAWGDNARLLKVGRVRISIDPKPPTDPFCQTLRLADGTIHVRYGKEDAATNLRLWVDANHPVVRVAIDGPKPTTATAAVELWRTGKYELPSIECSDVHLHRAKPGQKHAPTIVEPDTVLKNQTGRVGWHHHNAKSVGPAMTAKIQGLTEFERPDPLLHRTFGAVIKARGGRRLDELRLQSPGAKSHEFSIYVLTEHPATPEQWLAAMDRTIAETEKTDAVKRRAGHERWWSEFWGRSWINVTQGKAVKGASQIPANKHPVRIGMDQGGGSRFGGEFGRIAVYGRAFTEAQIGELAATPREKDPASAAAPLYAGRPKAPLTIDGSKDWDFADGLTVEAWIKPPSRSGGGRIFDKITPGKDDGILFDTHPGHSLRLITTKTLAEPNVLPAEKWSHVAAVVNNKEGTVRLFLDGKPLEASEVAQVAGNDATVVSRAYALQRFVDACAGRGRYPIKFNGSIFTVPYPGKPGDADYRRWGPGYWWQNTRLPYLSMCASGDFEMMMPLFRMYAVELTPLNKYRTRHYCGHGGIYIPECIYFWGDHFSETYGWTPFEKRGKDKLQASGWHKWEWVSGPELAFMMLDYCDYTQDREFLEKTVVPFANEVLTFFDQHYQTDDKGKLVMHPSQAVETWWTCTNPMPEVAGLHAVTQRLLALPESLTTAGQRKFWQAFRKKIPELPIREVNGVKMFAPAEKFANKRNIENPELYAVFPFRLSSFEKPNAPLGVEALKHRWNRGNSGWRQDDLFMAYLGLADDARANLVRRSRTKHGQSRFPAFWGPNYDWIPDQDHGGVLMKALQAMLLQVEGDKIYLLPAWPKDWDVDFKLHAPMRTVVECTYRGGKIVNLKVTPESRRQHLVLPED